MTIHEPTEEELRETAKNNGSWGDYYLFNSTINTALRYYRNKLVIILDDEEITKTNELLRKDLFDNLRVVQNALEDLSKNQEVLNNPRGQVFNYLSSISTALSLYENDVKHSKNIAAEKLNNTIFMTVDREIKAVSQAR